jgi:hypothetical protein
LIPATRPEESDTLAYSHDTEEKDTKSYLLRVTSPSLFRKKYVSILFQWTNSLFQEFRFWLCVFYVVFSFVTVIYISFVHRKGVVISGGYLDGVPTNKTAFVRMESFCSCPYVPLPGPLAGHSIVVLSNQKKYLFGGFTPRMPHEESLAGTL